LELDGFSKLPQLSVSRSQRIQVCGRAFFLYSPLGMFDRQRAIAKLFRTAGGQQPGVIIVCLRMILCDRLAEPVERLTTGFKVSIGEQ